MNKGLTSRRTTAYREAILKAGSLALPFYIAVLMPRMYIMPAKFEIRKSKTGQYTFNLLALNGKVILTGEVCTTKIDVVRHIESVKKYAANNGNYQRRASGKEVSSFVLKGANGHILGKSRMYSSIAGMEKGIASVKANAPCARVYDWTTETDNASQRGY